MISRAERHFCLRLKTIKDAAAISFVICAVLPVLACACLVAGWLGFGLCWLLVIVMGLLSFGLVIGGVLVILGGLAMLKEKGAPGCGAAIGGLLGLVLGRFLVETFQPYWIPIQSAAGMSVAFCKFGANFLFHELWAGYHVWILSWLPLFAALVAAGIVYTTIGVLRMEAPAKYAFLRIGYRCPTCHNRAVPAFRCSSCNALITDLEPTPYGVFHARCDKCDTLLPTADILGRLKLAKVCRQPGCLHDLNDPALGRSSEFHLAIVGSVSSGKSNLFISALWQFESEFARRNHLTIEFPNVAEEQIYRQWAQRLQTGQVFDKTVSVQVPKAFNLTVKPQNKASCLLYLYDAAGEDFVEESRMEGFKFHEYVDGLMFVLDPFAEQSVREHLTQNYRVTDFKLANPSPIEAADVMARLIGRLERILRTGTGRKFPIPIAIVVTKIDACHLHVDLKGREIPVNSLKRSYGAFSIAAETAERQTPKVRAFLEEMHLGNFIHVVESRFARVSYFVASSFGRPPDPSSNKPVTPVGVIAPLVWLCYRAGALSDSGMVVRGFHNWWVNFRRALRGQDTQRAQFTAWGFTICAFALLVCGIWLGISAFN